MEKFDKEKYWKTNLICLIIFITLWAVIGLLLPIVFAEYLNQFKLGGVPLGFWFSTQGSLFCMILLLLIYSALMNKLDDKFYNSMKE